MARRLEGGRLHPPGTPFEDDRWELYHLDRDFSETDDLAAQGAGAPGDDHAWWGEAERTRCCRSTTASRPRFAENAARAGRAQQFVFHAGMGHVPTDVAPDVRSRSYPIEADVEIATPAPRAC